MSALTSLRLFASVSRLHIVAIAALGTLTFGWVFTGRYAWILAVVTALDWFTVNLLNRVVDLEEDRANEIRGTSFVERHRRLLTILGFSVLVGSLVAFHPIHPGLLPLRVAFHSLGLAYNWPLLPGGRRIKELYFFKNTASATGFMLTVFGFPLVALPQLGGLQGDISVSTVILASGFFFLFELSYEVLYDLRDAAGDRLAGVRTYPVVHGEAVAVRITDALVIGSVAFLVVGYAVGAVPWRLAVMAVAPVLQLVMYKRMLARGIRSSDCVAITWIGAGLLASYHVWIALDLPGVAA